MTLALDPSDPLPLYRQLAGALRRQIAEGVLQAGERVPTVRELAVLARVNRNTAARTIQILEAEGLVTTRVGQGTFVTPEAAALCAERGLDAVDQALDEAVDRALREGVPLAALPARLAARIDARHEKGGGGRPDATPEEPGT